MQEDLSSKERIRPMVFTIDVLTNLFLLKTKWVDESIIH